MKMRWMVVGVLFLCGCLNKEAVKQETLDFETLMGKNTSAWKYIQTREDFDNLSFFKTLYDKNISFIQTKPTKPQMVHIPKVIHFIWIGPRAFPLESVENIRSWIGKHSDWTFKFWTDRDRPLPHPKMQKCMVQDLHFLKLYDCYKKSDNYGEKSDILRYEILYQEGGLYVDHDVKCFKSFEPLNMAYDFYVGMDTPFTTPLSSCVFPTNNIVASRPGHPILKQTLDWLTENWDRIETAYPGRDRDSVINRVAHRTFSVLGDSIKLLADKEGNRDIIFPSFFFNAPTDVQAIYSRHLYNGTWFENETPFEKLVRERLVKISKKSNQIMLFFGIITLVNVTGFTILFLKYRRLSRKHANSGSA